MSNISFTEKKVVSNIPVTDKSKPESKISITEKKHRSIYCYHWEKKAVSNIAITDEKPLSNIAITDKKKKTVSNIAFIEKKNSIKYCHHWE